MINVEGEQFDPFKRPYFQKESFTKETNVFAKQK